MQSIQQVYDLVSRFKCKLIGRNIQSHGGRPGLFDVYRADGHLGLGLDLGFRAW
jgi:hypothetical protein